VGVFIRDNSPSGERERRKESQVVRVREEERERKTLGGE